MLPLVMLMSLPADAAPPKTPDAIAQVTVADDTDQADWVLTLHRRYKNRVIGEGPHLTQPSTAFKPDLDRGDGEVWWLVGHRLHTLNNPGDVTVTASLLVAVPAGGDGAVRALWHEDHQTVPTELWVGGGTWAATGAGAGALELSLKETEVESTLSVAGLLR